MTLIDHRVTVPIGDRFSGLTLEPDRRDQFPHLCPGCAAPTFTDSPCRRCSRTCVACGAPVPSWADRDACVDCMDRANQRDAEVCVFCPNDAGSTGVCRACTTDPFNANWIGGRA